MSSKFQWNNSVIIGVNVNIDTVADPEFVTQEGYQAIFHKRKMTKMIFIWPRRGMPVVAKLIEKNYAQFMLFVFWPFVTLFLFKVTLFELQEKEKEELLCDQRRYFLWTIFQTVMIVGIHSTNYAFTWYAVVFMQSLQFTCPGHLVQFYHTNNSFNTPNGCKLPDFM